MGLPLKKSAATLGFDALIYILSASRDGASTLGCGTLKMLCLWVFLGTIGLLSAGSIVWTTLRAGISPMPSSGKATRAMLDLIPENAGDCTVELGSGWGGLARALSRRRPEADIVAYELSFLPWLWSMGIARLAGHQRVTFVRRNFFDTELGEADVVLCYLFPGAMERLSKRLTQLKPGSVIISNTFRLPGWEPDEVVELDDLYRTPVYRYVVGREDAS